MGRLWQNGPQMLYGDGTNPTWRAWSKFLYHRLVQTISHFVTGRLQHCSSHPTAITVLTGELHQSILHLTRRGRSICSNFPSFSWSLSNHLPLYSTRTPPQTGNSGLWKRRDATVAEDPVRQSKIKLPIQCYCKKIIYKKKIYLYYNETLKRLLYLIHKILQGNQTRTLHIEYNQPCLTIVTWKGL